LSQENGRPFSHAAYPELIAARATPGSLFGLAPGGVCNAPDVAIRAVGSYPAFSPLPPLITHQITAESFTWLHFQNERFSGGGIFSVALSLTGKPATGCYPAPCPAEPGLSSHSKNPMRDRPARSLYKIIIK